MVYKKSILVISFLMSLTALHSQNLYYEAGIRAIRDLRYNDAISYLEKAHEDKYQNPDLYLALSLLYQKNELYNESAELLKEALTLWEENIFTTENTPPDYINKVNLNLANSYFSIDELDQALALYNELEKQGAYLQDTHLNRGNTYLELKEYTLAADDYQAYLDSFTGESVSPQDQKLNKLIPLLRQLAKNDNTEETASEKDVLDAIVKSLHGDPEED